MHGHFLLASVLFLCFLDSLFFVFFLCVCVQGGSRAGHENAGKVRLNALSTREKAIRLYRSRFSVHADFGARSVADAARYRDFFLTREQWTDSPVGSKAREAAYRIPLVGSCMRFDHIPPDIRKHDTL